MPSVPLGSPLKKESKLFKIKRYINNKKYKFILATAYVINEFQVKKKSIQLFTWIINIIVTGLLISYILSNTNFISIGLAVVVGLYYLDLIVQIIKRPYNDK